MKKWFSLLIAVIAVLAFPACSRQSRTTRQTFAFDTVINITTDKKDVSAIGQAFELCRKYEMIFSRTNPQSELFSVNSRKNTSPSRDIMKVLEFSMQLSALTDGAFDVTVAPLVDLWNVGERTAPPEASEIAEALSLVGYDKVSLSPFDPGGTRLDMGAVAKGFIADKLIEEFRKSGITDVIVDLGGNVAVLGEYTVGIRDPFNPGDIYAAIRLKDKSAVTSGAYQRYFEHDGKRYHHIIDPRTGKCADSGIASATVISPSSMHADALSTAIFVMGRDALSLCKAFPGTDALIITDSGEVITTEGFPEKYNLDVK